MKSENTKGFREGAMMVALTAVLLFVSRYIPLLSMLGMIISCLPLAVLAARTNFKVVIPSLIAAFLITFLIDGNILSAVSTLLSSYIPGVVLGYMLGQRKPFFLTLLVTSTVVAVGWIFELLLLELLMDNGIKEIFDEIFKQSEAIMLEITKNLEFKPKGNLNLSAEELVSSIFKTAQNTITAYFPSIVVISSMLRSYIILRLCSFVLKRAKLAEVETVPFSMIIAPRSMSTVAIITYLIYIFTDPTSSLFPILGNVIFILYTIIGICGLSVIDFKFKSKIKTDFLRFLIYGLVFLFGGVFMSIISSVLIIIGIMDASRDFRRIKTDNI